MASLPGEAAQQEAQVRRRKLREAFDRGRLVGMIEMANFSLQTVLQVPPPASTEEMQQRWVLASPIFDKRYRVMLEQM